MRRSGKASLRTWALGRNEDFERELGKGEVNMKTGITVKVWSQLSRQHMSLGSIYTRMYK